MLSALLRFTDSDYPFGIFKPFYPKFNFSTLHITIPHEHVKTSLAEIIHKTWLATLQDYSFGSRINICRRKIVVEMKVDRYISPYYVATCLCSIEHLKCG